MNQLLIGYASICPELNFHSSFPPGLPLIIIKVCVLSPTLEISLCVYNEYLLLIMIVCALIMNGSTGGSVGVILNQHHSSTSLPDPSITTTKDQLLEPPLLIKRQLNNDTLDSCQSSQADWIRQYVEQQEQDVI